MPRIRLKFNDFGWEAVSGTAERYGLGVGEFVSASCRRYLASPDEAPIPVFARSRLQGLPREVTVDLDRAELGLLEHLGDGYGIPLEVVIRHAVLVLVADIDSGRVGAELSGEAPSGRNA